MVHVPEQQRRNSVSYRTGKFDHLTREDVFMASKIRYMPFEAEMLCHAETGWTDITLGEAFVRYVRTENESDGIVYDWALETTEHERSCPVWVYRKQ